MISSLIFLISSFSLEYIYKENCIQDGGREDKLNLQLDQPLEVLELYVPDEKD